MAFRLQATKAERQELLDRVEISLCTKNTPIGNAVSGGGNLADEALTAGQWVVVDPLAEENGVAAAQNSPDGNALAEALHDVATGWALVADTKAPFYWNTETDEITDDLEALLYQSLMIQLAHFIHHVLFRDSTRVLEYLNRAQEAEATSLEVFQDFNENLATMVMDSLRECPEALTIAPLARALALEALPVAITAPLPIMQTSEVTTTETTVETTPVLSVTVLATARQDATSFTSNKKQQQALGDEHPSDEKTTMIGGEEETKE